MWRERASIFSTGKENFCAAAKKRDLKKWICSAQQERKGFATKIKKLRKRRHKCAKWRLLYVIKVSPHLPTQIFFFSPWVVGFIFGLPTLSSHSKSHKVHLGFFFFCGIIWLAAAATAATAAAAAAPTLVCVGWVIGLGQVQCLSLPRRRRKTRRKRSCRCKLFLHAALLCCLKCWSTSEWDVAAASAAVGCMQQPPYCSVTCPLLLILVWKDAETKEHCNQTEWTACWSFIKPAAPSMWE